MAYERLRGAKYPNKNLMIQMKEVTLDGSNPTPVTMEQLKVVKFAVAVYKRTTAPALDPSAGPTVDYNGTDNIVNVYAWKPTAAADCTAIASTNATQVCSVMAMGSIK